MWHVSKYRHASASRHPLVFATALVVTASVATAGVAAGSVHTTPGTSAGYVALGDSYASGLGSFSYLPGTTSGPAACYRAKNGYVEQLAKYSGLTLDFAACSGSTIGSLVTGSSPQDHGVGSATKLVTISVGGDDVGFSEVLTSCIAGPLAPGSKGCASRDKAAVKTAFGWLQNGRPPGCYKLPGINGSGKVVMSCNSVKLPSLTQLYEQIASAAPKADVLVIAYPTLFESKVAHYASCRVGTTAGVAHYAISASDISWIDTEQTELASIMRQSVTTASHAESDSNLLYLNTPAAFHGHGLCDSSSAYINGLLFKNTYTVENESFHPNVAGQNAFAKEIEPHSPHA